MIKNGGKLLSKGSSTCLLTPEIPCKKLFRKNKNKKKSNRLTKIIYSKKKKPFQQEKKINKKIKSIKNYNH